MMMLGLLYLQGLIPRPLRVALRSKPVINYPAEGANRLRVIRHEVITLQVETARKNPACYDAAITPSSRKFVHRLHHPKLIKVGPPGGTRLTSLPL